MSERRAHERALRQNRQVGGGAESAGERAGGAGGGSQSTRQFQLQLRTSTDTQ